MWVKSLIFIEIAWCTKVDIQQDMFKNRLQSVGFYEMAHFINSIQACHILLLFVKSFIEYMDKARPKNCSGGHNWAEFLSHYLSLVFGLSITEKIWFGSNRDRSEILQKPDFGGEK